MGCQNKPVKKETSIPLNKIVEFENLTVKVGYKHYDSKISIFGSVPEYETSKLKNINLIIPYKISFMALEEGYFFDFYNENDLKKRIFFFGKGITVVDQDKKKSMDYALTKEAEHVLNEIIVRVLRRCFQ